MKKKEIRKKEYGKEGPELNVRKKESEGRKKEENRSMVQDVVVCIARSVSFDCSDTDSSTVHCCADCYESMYFILKYYIKYTLISNIT